LAVRAALKLLGGVADLRDVRVDALVERGGALDVLDGQAAGLADGGLVDVAHGILPAAVFVALVVIGGGRRPVRPAHATAWAGASSPSDSRSVKNHARSRPSTAASATRFPIDGL